MEHETMTLGTANGQFKPLLDQGLLKPFFATNQGKRYTRVVTFKQNPVIGDRIYLRSMQFADNVHALTVITQSQLANVYSGGSSYALPTADQYKGAVLVLNTENDNEIGRISLGGVAFNSELGKIEFQGLPVSWKRSYIVFYDDNQGLTTNDAFALKVYYK